MFSRSLIFLTTLFLLSCSWLRPDAFPNQDPEMVVIEDIVWYLTTLNGERLQFAEPAQTPFLRLAPDTGRLEAFGGCNSVAGQYQLLEQAIRFSNMISTKRFCSETQELEQKFLKNLSTTTGWQTSTGLFTLVDENGAALLTFHREDG